MPKKKNENGFLVLLLLSMICVTMVLTYFPNSLRDISIEYFSQLKPSFGLENFSLNDVYSNKTSSLASNETTRLQIGTNNNQSITTPMSSINNPKQLPDPNVFVVIPFRDREEHKNVFVEEMNVLLKKKNLNYKLIFVEQQGKDPFNRGKLLNVGVIEALSGLLNNLNPHGNGMMDIRLTSKEIMDASIKNNLSICFIFHDIDMIPENEDIPYNCTDSPILLAASVQQYNYKLPYETYFGGVTAMKLKEIIKINGYPNRYWGWGGEDDDVYNRCLARQMQPKILSSTIGVFKSLSHELSRGSQVFEERFDELKETVKKIDEDGIQQVNYTILESKVKPEYTHIIVDLLRTK